MKRLLFAVMFLSIFIFVAKGLSLNISINSTPLSMWVSNQTLHYRYYNLSYTPLTSIKIGPTNFSFTDTYTNFYYLGKYNENKTKIGTIFRLGTVAYPQSFIVSMVQHNFTACSSNSTNNISTSFFSALCKIYKMHLNVSLSPNETPETNATIKALVAETMPNDIFTKQLYSLYYNYSSVCTTTGTETNGTNSSATNNYGVYDITYNPKNSSIFTVSECLGNKTNPALPYFLDYMKYILSLYYFMNVIDNYTPSILYYSIYYDMKNFNVFPIAKTPELIQSDIALMGVYPGVIPSGLDAEEMLNYSQLGLPINYFKDNNITALTKNGIDVYSGVYNNITMFVALKNALNPYAYYNISTKGSPFSGSVSAGPIQYADSCSGGIGLSTAEYEEEEQMKKSIYEKLSSLDLYPENQYFDMAFVGNRTLYSYGPSIIEAIPQNIQVNNNSVTYGVKYYNKTIAYEKNVTVPFSPNQTLLVFNIPTNAIKHKADVHQLFATLHTNYSYEMNYYGFNTYFSQPTFNITHGQYQKVEMVQKGNQTIPVTVTCYTSSVSGSMTYNSTKTFIADKTYNYSVSKETYINVSTNMSIKNVFKLNQEGYAQNLNYSYVLYKSSSPKIKSFSNVTIPSGTTVQLFTLNNTPLEEFTASYAPDTTITGSGSKNLFLYAPTYVFPNIYQGINYYYPTISSFANNMQYELAYDTYVLGLRQGGGFVSGILGMINLFINGVTSTISHYLFGANITMSPAFQVVVGEHEAQQYYLEGCPYTKIGNLCIAPPPQYILSNKETISQSDYNLLNPILYTQNMHYTNAESTFWVCSKVDFWKSVLLGVYPSVANWQSCNYDYDLNGINELYFTNVQLLFNETWANFTPQEKMMFYNYLVNNSTYYNNTYYGKAVISGQYSELSNYFGRVGVYSTVFPPTFISNKVNSSANNNFTINNRIMNLNISGAYDGMKLNECIFDMCYSANLYPTKVYTMLNYNYVYVGNDMFNVSIYPNEYNNESILLSNTIHDPATAEINFEYSINNLSTYSLETNFTAPATFYVKEIPSKNVTMFFANDTLYIEAPAFTNFILKLSFGQEELPPVLNGSYNFIILKQTLTINTNISEGYSETTWLAILFAIIIIIILWRIRYFEPLKEEIRYRLNRFKEG